ncbi:MAG: hypothetical protein U0359_34945 [Byssovorax sp.]
MLVHAHPRHVLDARLERVRRGCEQRRGGLGFVFLHIVASPAGGMNTRDKETFSKIRYIH